MARSLRQWHLHTLPGMGLFTQTIGRECAGERGWQFLTRKDSRDSITISVGRVFVVDGNVLFLKTSMKQPMNGLPGAIADRSSALQKISFLRHRRQ